MNKSDGSGWSMVGWFLVIMGLLSGYLGFSYETTVETTFTGSIYDIQQPQSVQNLGLMLNKLLMLSSAIAATIAGIICLATSALLRQSYVPVEKEEMPEEGYS